MRPDQVLALLFPCSIAFCAFLEFILPICGQSIFLLVFLSVSIPVFFSSIFRNASNHINGIQTSLQKFSGGGSEGLLKIQQLCTLFLYFLSISILTEPQYQRSSLVAL